ncbi:sigma-54-dependent transcriptional regulator [Salidesulfovibrio brasiliensis]|uniref:sigma-54-dependent transcriptional regulator n=1 Tax=Salidesulfovibrio brasiliensis TaxID=221711 RepID=UPI0006D18B4C|nr:sigma-54 dependent transcriptional regulator [Salidesulfovibrio brasiliensis]
MKDSHSILVVDDEKDFASGIARLLESRFPGETIAACHSGAEALEHMEEHPYDVVFSDLKMPGMDGLELVERMCGRWSGTTMVMLSAHGTIEQAVRALKNGAYDFLTKPVEPDALFRVADKALERSRLLGENARLKTLLACRSEMNCLVGDSPAIRHFKDSLAAVAQSDYTVLILGESGTGKELAARVVHKLSARTENPMVAVNCPAIPEQLLESELFGHVKGAFTGADRARKGLFVNAEGGSLLLDEIGDLPMGLQTKLLRCLQEQEIRPVGASRNIPVNVRILASTNRALEERIAEGEFREDLFYRLNVLTVTVPPLRDRIEDIPLLAHHFIEETCLELKVPPKEPTPEALSYLAARPWPGNVRELQNFVRRLAVFATGDSIDMSVVRIAESGAPSDTNGGLVSYKQAKAAVVEDFTRTYVRKLLEATTGNVSEAARISGLSRVALQKILKRLEISPDRFR